MKDHLIFDVTNADTILDSDSVGSFVRANDGTLITKHSISEVVKAGLISQGLVFVSKLAGVIGNTYSFKVEDDAIPGPLTYTEVGGDIILDLHAGTPTTTQVVTLLMTTTPNSYVDVSVGIPTGNVIVAAQQDLFGGENTNYHKHLDVYAALADGFGNAITSTGGAIDVNIKSSNIVLNVDLNGIYNVGSNPTPDNAGMIAFNRATTPALSDQLFTPTGGLAGVSGITANTIHGIDVNSAMMALNGSGTMDAIKSTTNALWVNIQNSTVTVNDAALANVAIVANKEILAVANTAQVAVTSPLTDRKYLSLYNMDNQKVYFGGIGVSAATGFPVSPGSYLELRAGASSAVYFVGSTGKTPEIRHLELS